MLTRRIEICLKLWEHDPLVFVNDLICLYNNPMAPPVPLANDMTSGPEPKRRKVSPTTPSARRSGGPRATYPSCQQTIVESSTVSGAPDPRPEVSTPRPQRTTLEPSTFTARAPDPWQRSPKTSTPQPQRTTLEPSTFSVSPETSTSDPSAV